MRRLLPPVLFLLCFVVMSLLHRYYPVAAFVPSWLRIAAVLLALAGLGLANICARQFARVGTNIMTFNEPDKLVVEGPFRYSRNPIYLGFALSLLGIALAFGSATPLLVWIAFVIVTDRWYIAFEEQAMTQKFGAAYLNYRRCTPRWL